MKASICGTLSGPAPFNLERLFYLGSEKGQDDIGQYGEGFKVAATCLLRDHGVEPIAVSTNQIIYMRISEERVGDTELQPVVYDFFRRQNPSTGSCLILRGCSQKLIQALRLGLSHFFYEGNPLLGPQLWISWDKSFAIYSSRGTSGHVFYRKLKRGDIPDIPVILVINKEYAAIEKKIKHDRDRNAFGDVLMNTFYNIFARSGLKNNQTGQRAVVEAARACWGRGHSLLSEVANAEYWRSSWPADVAKAVFGNGYFARCSTENPSEQIEFAALERSWQEEGRTCLPAYFSKFGVLNARQYLEACGSPISGQGEVWSDISMLQGKACCMSPTSAMSDGFKAREAEFRQCEETFRPVPNQIGLIAIIDGRPAGLDLVSLTDAFTKLHPKLVRSYTLDGPLDSISPKSPKEGQPEASAEAVPHRPYAEIASQFR